MVVPIQVAVRIRPPLPEEDVVISFVPDSKQVLVNNSIICSADYVFPPETSQGFIYDACLVNRINFLFEGHDIFILSFGKCSTGKTHTLFQLNCSGYNISYGIVPLAVHHIFNTLSRFQVHNYFRYSVYINFFEIINGEIHDLLSLYPDDNDAKKYSLSFTNKGSAVLNGVENILCRNVNEVFGCLQIGLQSKLGNKNDHKDCNSHTFFIITVYQQWIYNGGCENKVSKATFIDLGGFDRFSSESNNSSNGNEFNFLSDILDYCSEERNNHNGENELFLPALIRDAFTVSSSTLLICCLSPNSKNAGDSIEQLQLVNRIRDNYYISDGLSNYVCDSATEASSQELEYYTLQQDMYVSLVTSQWMKLVANAEGLFNRLAQTGLPKEAKQQIENWLCLKQEYDECFLDSPTAQKNDKSLECIEEESERNSSSCLTSLNSENETSEVVVQKIEFTTTIKNESRRPFDSPSTTKDEYSSKSESCISKCADEESLDDDNKQLALQEDSDDGKNSLNSSPMYRRRKTLMPEDVNFVISKFGAREGTSQQDDTSSDTVDRFSKKSYESKKNNLFQIARLSKQDSDSDSDCSLSDNNLALVKSCGRTKTIISKKDELKVLSSATESKQAQINLIILDIEGAHERIEELNEIIKIKEEFITDMIDQSNMTNSAKVKLKKKLYKLEEEYSKTRSNLIKAEKAVKRGDLTALTQIEKYRNLSEHYEKRLQDLKTIQRLAGDSAKKVFELESSLFNSKKKLQKLLKQIKREEEYKRNLEKELESDKKKVQELEEKLTNCYLSDQSCDSNRSKQIQIEEKRLKTLKESSQVLQEQLNKQKYLLMKRDGFLKDKSKQKCTCLDLSDSSNKYEGTINDEVREELRLEIRNLRKTRECLVEQRRKLDRKIKKEKVFTPQEERQFLECDEAVEAIDAAIEYKNEIMFGHLQTYEDRDDWENNDELLIERLMKLSHPELRILFTKYFRKVIDLRESGRKLEQSISEQDVQMEAQAWKVQTLSNALQQSRIESERRLIMVHREHQEKLHLMFRQYATGETSGPSSSVERDGDKLYLHDGNKLYLQNKQLKHRVVELEGMLPTHKRSAMPNSSNVVSTALSIPHENINKLPNKPAFITKVTRQKNKLIIQQQKTKKRSK